MYRLSGLLLAALLLLAGCAKKTGVETGEPGQPLAKNDATGPSTTGPLESKNGNKPNATENDLSKNMPKLPPPDPKTFQIPKTGEGKWIPTKMKLTELAAKVGTAMRGMKDTEGKTVTTLTTPAGNGMIQSDIKVQDSKHYSIGIAVVQTMPAQSEFIANGAQKAFRGPNGTIESTKPITTPGPDAALEKEALVKKWPAAFPRLLYRGIVEGKDPWGPVLTGLAAPNSGFVAEISERTLTLHGKPIKSYRFTAKRKASEAKKLGPCEMEMVFDSQRSLPVTIRVVRKDPKEGDFKVQWSTGWRFDKKFPPESFKF